MRFLSNLVASTLGTLAALALVVFFLFIFVMAIALATDQTPSVRSGSVLVVELTGAIPEVVSDDPLVQALGGQAGYDLTDFTFGLKKAAADERIEAVWLQVKDVDAAWATLEEMRSALLAFKQSGKPVIASSDDYAMAEPEYFLASTADSVFASEQGMFEFNGFYITVEFYKNLLDRLEVKPQVIRAGRFKSAVEPFIQEELSSENAEQLRSLLASQNTVFMQAVAESRALSPDLLQQLADEGAIMKTNDALRAGLLDGLLYRDEVVEVLKRRLGHEEDDDLREVTLSDYARVPATAAGLSYEGDDEIAVVYARGAIVSGESGDDPVMGGSTVGAETFNEAIREAREADRVKSVVVRINSPGGSAAASDAMWREISLTAQEKPVIVSMGDMAASGGYWIATAADAIVADPLTITGSIGVFALLFDVSGLFENKIGITFEQLRTSPYADLFSGVRSLSAPEERLLQQWVNETYTTFLDRVSESRGLDVARVDTLGQGRVWTGADAHRLGLVDVLGGLDAAVAIAAEKAGLPEGLYRTRILPRPKSFIERIASELNGRAARLWMHLGTTPVERMVMQQARTLQRLTDDHATLQARLPVDISIR